MSLIYSVGNFINVNTLFSVSSEDPLYVKENLYNQRPSLAFRFDSKTDQDIIIDLGAATKFTLLALVNHNLQSAATMALMANPTNAWGAPAYSDPITWREENLYKKLDQTYRWVRVFISDPTNPDKLEIGELILYVYSSFTEAHIQSQQEGDSYYTAEQETFMGQDWDAALSRSAQLSMKIRKVSTAGDSVAEEIRALLRTLQGSAGRFFVVPDDTHGECYYVKVKGSDFLADRIFHNVKDIRDWELPLKELSQGISLR